MTDQPLVSILMTVYNREKYIAEAIESVISSTYQNWELIIVDDQSKDKSVEIAKSYEINDPRIKVYINEQNLGDYPNRNKAASYANGKYIKYLDADDIIYEHSLEYMVTMMERHTNAGWATFSLKQNPHKPHPYILSPIEQFKGQYIYGFGYFLRSPLSVIIRSDIFNDQGGFKEQKMIGDFEMWHRIGIKYNLLVMPHSHGFVWYRTHEQQQSFAINQYEYQYRQISYNYINSAECELNKEMKKLALTKLRNRYYKRIIKLIISLNFAQLRYV